MSCDTTLLLRRALCGRIISPRWLKTLSTAALEAGTLKARITCTHVSKYIELKYEYKYKYLDVKYKYKYLKLVLEYNKYKYQVHNTSLKNKL